MKKFFPLLAAALGWLPVTALPQSFSFTADTLARRGNPGDLIILDGHIKNLGVQDLQIRVVRMPNNLPPGWSTSLCSGDLCFPPFLNFYTIPDTALGIPALAPGETSEFHLNFNTDPAQAGTAAVPIRVENIKNTAEFVELTFTASTQPAVVTDLPPGSPADFRLLANFPNPFTTATTIPFEIGGGRPLPVELLVYNLLGREVARLNLGMTAPGRREITWQGRDHNGRVLPRGLYFYQLRVGAFRQTRVMLLLQ
ncbi:MAG: hypothetical protein ONB48_11520 [candidate division KSB1 bacterium]|nr:hypothetical protein [candidate division KSB1 bacterium]MDZ7275417.1 hypothetical protein [candidate division KSB1 bacterium]MDZ7286271.1 hypothetical protein [candidate division KSB1 bacterium]MDZ7296497.1 hypothetical protein [candidate division KSB1 bacterium]MDZ7305545.1 hypothetical protein [candidate division KSB1 bacterium]